MNPYQRTPEWHEARAGKLTASTFAAAMGIDPYKSRAKLWREIKGLEPPFEGNAATDWGTENEQNAISAYEVDTGNIVTPVGFIVHPLHDWLGASPDGFVGSKGRLECKCPYNGEVHRVVPEHYAAQVQGGMEISSGDWCDFYSWTPGEQNLIHVERDPDYWAWAFPLLQEFWNYVLEDREPPRLKAKPVYQPRKE